MPRSKHRVLFVCTGNSARSIFAEAILRKDAGDRFEVFSAGARPRSEVNPVALEILEQKGHDITGLRSKNLAAFQGPDAVHVDFVFTVCNRAANEECPPWDGQPVSAHWGIPDPAATAGTEAERRLLFQQTYDALQKRLRAFAALPINSLDRLSLQRAVDDISKEKVLA